MILNTAQATALFNIFVEKGNFNKGYVYENDKSIFVAKKRMDFVALMTTKGANSYHYDTDSGSRISILFHENTPFFYESLARITVVEPSIIYTNDLEMISELKQAIREFVAEMDSMTPETVGRNRERSEFQQFLYNPVAEEKLREYPFYFERLIASFPEVKREMRNDF